MFSQVEIHALTLKIAVSLWQSAGFSVRYIRDWAEYDDPAGPWLPPVQDPKDQGAPKRSYRRGSIDALFSI